MMAGPAILMAVAEPRNRPTPMAEPSAISLIWRSPRPRCNASAFSLIFLSPIGNCPEAAPSGGGPGALPASVGPAAQMMRDEASATGFQGMPDGHVLLKTWLSA